jgi:hypothetical protein
MQLDHTCNFLKSINPSTQGLKQEDFELEASLGYMRPCLKQTKKAFLYYLFSDYILGFLKIESQFKNLLFKKNPRWGTSGSCL